MGITKREQIILALSNELESTKIELEAKNLFIRNFKAKLEGKKLLDEMAALHDSANQVQSKKQKSDQALVIRRRKSIAKQPYKLDNASTAQNNTTIEVQGADLKSFDHEITQSQPQLLMIGDELKKDLANNESLLFLKRVIRHENEFYGLIENMSKRGLNQLFDSIKSITVL